MCSNLSEHTLFKLVEGKATMINHELVHPDILHALGSCGHGSKVLIADGDFPVSTTLGSNATVVRLNLSPGIVKATEVLAALILTCPLEAGVVMAVPDGVSQPEIWLEYETQLREAGHHFRILENERFSFYEECETKSMALVIQTAETKEYANLLLTIGSRF